MRVAAVLPAALALLVLALSASRGSSATQATTAAPCKNSSAIAFEIRTMQAEKAIRCLVNRSRKKAGLKPLRINRRLRKAARRHSRYGERTNCISHQCPGEPSLPKRLRTVGYPGCSNCSYGYGEAIGWRQGRRASARGIVKAWLASSNHRAILFDRQAREIGIGVAWGSPRASDPKKAVAGIFTAIAGFHRG